MEEKLQTLIEFLKNDEGAVEFIARGLGIGSGFVRAWMAGSGPSPSTLDLALTLAQEYAKKGSS